MRLVRMNRKAVREALADEGWRFTLTDSQAEFKQHHAECRGLTLPVASESTNRSRTIREQLVGQLPWDMRGQPFPRWMSRRKSYAALGNTFGGSGGCSMVCGN